MNIWYNDADIWYGFSDWIAADSVEECNKILAEEKNTHINCLRNYTWYKWREQITGTSRYLGFSKSCPS